MSKRKKPKRAPRAESPKPYPDWEPMVLGAIGTAFLVCVGVWGGESKPQLRVTDRNGTNPFLSQFEFRNESKLAMQSVEIWCAPRIDYPGVSVQGMDWGNTYVGQDRLAAGDPLEFRCKDPFVIAKRPPGPTFMLEITIKYNYLEGLNSHVHVCRYVPELTDEVFTGWAARACRLSVGWLGISPRSIPAEPMPPPVRRSAS